VLNKAERNPERLCRKTNLAQFKAKSKKKSADGKDDEK
jgi:hypothetical protein